MPTPKPDIRRIKKMIKYRKVHKLSYRDTAKMLGVTLHTIERWEKYLTGELKVSKKNVRKLSTVIKLDKKLRRGKIKS